MTNIHLRGAQVFYHRDTYLKTTSHALATIIANDIASHSQRGKTMTF